VAGSVWLHWISLLDGLVVDVFGCGIKAILKAFFIQYPDLKNTKPM
jgi:hypothetical protein